MSRLSIERMSLRNEWKTRNRIPGNVMWLLLDWNSNPGHFYSDCCNGEESDQQETSSAEKRGKGISLETNKIEVCCPLPKRREADRPAILLRFVSWIHKVALLKQGRNLKGSNVMMNDNLTKWNSDLARRVRFLKKQRKIQSTWCWSTRWGDKLHKQCLLKTTQSRQQSTVSKTFREIWTVSNNDNQQEVTIAFYHVGERETLLISVTSNQELAEHQTTLANFVRHCQANWYFPCRQKRNLCGLTMPETYKYLITWTMTNPKPDQPDDLTMKNWKPDIYKDGGHLTEMKTAVNH